MADHNININIKQPSAAGAGGAGGSFAGTVSDVQNLTASLNALTAKMEEVGAKSRESSLKSMQSVQAYSGSYKQLQAELAKTKNDLIDELATLKQLTGARTTGTNAIENQKARITELETKVKTLTAQQRNYITALNASSASMRSTGLAIQQLMGAFGYTTGIFGAILALKQVYSIISDFNQVNLRLKSIMGDNKEGFAELTKSAIELGAGSIFGAKGITEMQIELTKMQIPTQEILGMQKAISDLATATQYDIGEAAHLIATLLHDFKLPTTDATKIINIMGKAFNDSALKMGNFTESMQYIAPIAQKAGLSFAEMTALLEILANSGIRGSLAGTSLVNVFSKVENAQSKMSKSLKETGFGYEGLIGALIRLNEKGTEMPKIWQSIDRRAVTAFTTLLSGVKTVEELKSKLDSLNDVVGTQTSVQLESLSNKALLAKSAFQSWILSIDQGSGLISRALRSIYNVIAFTFNSGKSETESYLDTIKEVNQSHVDEAKYVSDLYTKYKTLTSGGKKLDADQTKELIGISTQLQVALGNNVVKFDLETGQIKTNTDEIMKNIIARRVLVDEDMVNEANKYLALRDKFEQQFSASTDYMRQLVEFRQLLLNSGGKFEDKALKQYLLDLKNWGGQFDLISESAQRLMATAKDPDSKELVRNFNQLYIATWNTDKSVVQLKNDIDKINEHALTLYPKNVWQQALKDIDAIKKNLGETGTPTVDAEAMAQLKKELELEKAIAIDRIKVVYDGEQQKKKIIETTYFYDLKIAKETIQSEKEKTLTIEKINVEHNLQLKEWRLAYNKELLGLEKDLTDAQINYMSAGNDKKRALIDADYENQKKSIANQFMGNSPQDIKLRNDALIAADLKYKESIRILDLQIQNESLDLINKKNIAKIKIESIGYEQSKALEEESFAKEMDDIYTQANYKQITLEDANSKIELLTLEHNEKLRQIEKDHTKEINDLILKNTILRLELYSNGYKYDKQVIESTYQSELADAKNHYTEGTKAYVLYVENLKLERDKALKALTTKDKSLAELLFPNLDEIQSLKMEKSIDQMKTGIKSLVDAWKSGTDDIVSQYDRQVSEAQSALDTELQLSGQGYASNVTLKRKELADIKAARASAMKDQIAAERAQLAIDNATTISDMAVTFWNILKGASHFGLIGIPLAIAGIATIWEMFTQWKTLIAKEKAVSFGSGGEISGQPHSRGGVMINAEGGEYVIKRQSYINNKELVQAINKDDRIVLDKFYLAGIRGGNMKHTVSLDDSKDLKAIRSLLEKQGKTVEFQNGYRIERFGNTTTRIKINYN